jgi:regulator of cell morphogenesis and NO signaling
MIDTTSLGPATTIGDIIARYPDTTPVFNRFGLDTCCGAGVSVPEAARRHGLDADAVLAALRDVLERR